MTWQPIETVPKDGRDIWLYFPLEGLNKSWERVKACHWNKEIELWTWMNRAYRSYSREYEPTYWQPLTDETPESP